MLKKSLVLLAISSALLFAGCTTPNDTTTPAPTQQEPAPPPQTPPPDKTTKPVGLTYSITSETYTVQNVTVTYPQIDTADATKEKQINELIKTEALKGIGKYEGAGTDLTLDIDYEVTWQGPRILSIQYAGVGYVQGAAHPNNNFYTTNIDLEKGKLLRLSEIINIDEDFLATFQAGKWKEVRPELEGLVLDQVTDEQFKNKLLEADVIGKSETYSYFTPNTFGISFSVPHALGDHAELEINTQDLTNHINTDQAIWNDFASMLIKK